MAALPDRRLLLAVRNVGAVLVVPFADRRRPAKVLVADDIAQESVAHLEGAVLRRQVVGHRAQGDFRHSPGQVQAAGCARPRGDGHRPFRRHDEAGGRIVRQVHRDGLQVGGLQAGAGRRKRRAGQVRDGIDRLVAEFHVESGTPVGQFFGRTRVRDFEHTVRVEYIKAQTVHFLLRIGRGAFRRGLHPVYIQGGIPFRESQPAAGQRSCQQQYRNGQ